MPRLTINGREVEFQEGQVILQAALDSDIEIPHYCYHPGLSIVANCRICLAEVWAPNPRNDNKLEPVPKLLPTCQTQAMDGQVVYSDSPKAVANQKAVMEYLLINHPLDCPVCDQAGECYLQDYSYKYGRGVSRFEESKIKQPKKDLGPNVLLYSDRCIMCSQCVRFCREVSGTSELIVEGRGATEQIDVFPGRALDNPIASNVIDLCPVGALLDKDFLFKKRVWDLTSTPSIDGITSSGDNIWIDHADGRVHRVRPRENADVNKWWITDEVRYGWKFVHSDDRLTLPLRRRFGGLVDTEWARAIDDAVSGLRRAGSEGRRVAALISPMLSCEDAWLLARAARAADAKAVLGVGPVPVQGDDRVFPPGAKADDPKRFVLRAEKAPNARGVRRVLNAMGGDVLEFDAFVQRLAKSDVGCAIITGNYPSDWATPPLRKALEREDLFVIACDSLNGPLVEACDALLPASTWAEKAGTFENADGRLQAFEPAIKPVEWSRPEAQIALDLLVGLGETGAMFDAAKTRHAMAQSGSALGAFATDVHLPPAAEKRVADMQVVEL